MVKNEANLHTNKRNSTNCQRILKNPCASPQCVVAGSSPVICCAPATDTRKAATSPCHSRKELVNADKLLFLSSVSILFFYLFDRFFSSSFSCHKCRPKRSQNRAPYSGAIFCRKRPKSANGNAVAQSCDYHQYLPKFTCNRLNPLK